MAKATVELARELLLGQYIDRRGRTSREAAASAVAEMWAWALPRLGRSPVWWFTARFHRRYGDLRDDSPPDTLITLVDWAEATPPWDDAALLHAIKVWRDGLPAADRSLIDASRANITHLTPLYLDLMRRLDDDLPTPGRVAPEANEADLTGLSLHRMLGDLTPDRRAVLEALLTAERGNQQFFGRLTFAVAGVEWLNGPQPDWDAPPPPKPPLPEQVVTWAFIVGCVVALGFVIYAVTK